MQNKPIAMRTVLPEDPLPFNEWVEKLKVSSGYLNRHIQELVRQDEMIREQKENFNSGKAWTPILSGTTPIKIKSWDE